MVVEVLERSKGGKRRGRIKSCALSLSLKFFETKKTLSHSTKTPLPFFFQSSLSLSLLASMNALALRSPGLMALRCVPDQACKHVSVSTERSDKEAARKSQNVGDETKKKLAASDGDVERKKTHHSKKQKQNHNRPSPRRAAAAPRRAAPVPARAMFGGGGGGGVSAFSFDYLNSRF